MSAHSYWTEVVAALKAEPRCETRDSFLDDMLMHEPVKNGDFDDMVCVACSRLHDRTVALAPCAWLTDWGKRLDVE